MSKCKTQITPLKRKKLSIEMKININYSFFKKNVKILYLNRTIIKQSIIFLMNINNWGKASDKIHYFSKYLNLFLYIYFPNFHSYIIKKRLLVSVAKIRTFSIVLPINNKFILEYKTSFIQTNLDFSVALKLKIWLYSLTYCTSVQKWYLCNNKKDNSFIK